MQKTVKTLIAVLFVFALSLIFEQTAFADGCAPRCRKNCHKPRVKVIKLYAPCKPCRKKVVLRPDLRHLRHRPRKVVVEVIHPAGCRRQKVVVKPIYARCWRRLPTLVVNHFFDRGCGLRPCRKVAKRCDPCGPKVHRRQTRPTVVFSLSKVVIGPDRNRHDHGRYDHGRHRDRGRYDNHADNRRDGHYHKNGHRGRNYKIWKLYN